MNGAYSEDQVKKAIQRHSEVQGKGLIRGHAKQQFAYGKMIPRGRRVPAGGRRGDTFTFYSDEQAEGPQVNVKDQMTTIFNHALVCDHFYFKGIG